ncbi:MAG: nitrous oxide reductase family maturation protein NosD, partial [Nitrospinota bacterium]
MLRFFLKPIVFCLFIIPGLSTVAFSKTLLVSQIPGEGVFSSISGASTQAEAGDTVFVEEGVYHERVVLKNGVTIQGAGTGLTRIEYSGKGPVVYGKNIKDGALENLSLTYRGEEKKSIIYLVSSTVAINQVVLFGGSLSGVEARGDSRVEIKGAVVKGNKGSGIFLYKGAKGYVEDSQIVGNRYFGIEVKSGALLSARNILVNENQAGGVNLMKDASLELHGSQIFENANYGVLINKGSSGKIVNNNILGNSRAGILVFSGGVSVIQNNIISYNGTGIRIHGEQLPFLSHNNVWNNGLAYENMKKPETDISLDPMFDSSYRLKRGSPMIGKGFWGQDIGAFPFDGGAAPVEPPSEKASPVIAREKREARPEGAVS